MADVLRARAIAAGATTAFTFLDGMRLEPRSITWSQLDQRATALAFHLRQVGVADEPVLVALHSGLPFIESLFACWYAGAIPVPISLPRHARLKERLAAVTADSRARFAIGTATTRTLVASPKVADRPGNTLTWIDPADAPPLRGTPDLTPGRASRLALLQYTSGSTGSPRGVMVTHTNLLHNSAMIAKACGHGRDDVIAAWLPLYHDMGLIGFIVQTAFVGMHCVLMPPERFLMQPWLWLRVMSDYHATGTAAPNFAYDLCVDRVTPEHKAPLNLSAWRNALNGSEPIRAATLERFAAAFADCGFRRSAYFLCYGLAEATLFVTGPSGPRAVTRRATNGAPLTDSEGGGHVGCGTPFPGTQVMIVDPDTCLKVQTGALGEIWVSGDSVTAGYWNNPTATAATFREDGWLRTGDLGFIDADGELYITGRLRELIIIAGRNHFPGDIEQTVEAADPAIVTSGCVAFSVDFEGLERLIVCAEIRREYLKPTAGLAVKEVDFESVRRNIARAVAAENDITVHTVVLLRPGTIPRTSSGKLRRLATRETYLNGSLDRLENPSDERVTV